MIYIEGWVEKKADYKFPAIWKKRYAMLSLSGGCSRFQYFKDESKTNLKGSIDLVRASKIRLDEQLKSNKKYQIIVHVNTEYTFKIALESEDSLNIWVDAFHRILLDTFNRLIGDEERSAEDIKLQSSQKDQENIEMLEELMVSTSLYRRGTLVEFEYQDRIICLDPADITVYNLALTEISPLRAARNGCPRSYDKPVLSMRLTSSLHIPLQVLHKGDEHIVDIRSVEATLRVVFRNSSTANAWLEHLLTLRCSAVEINKCYLSAGLSRLEAMIPTASTEQDEAPDEVFYKVLDDEIHLGTDKQPINPEAEISNVFLPTSCLSAPTMYIAILVVGTRGDVQPFVHLGVELHRRGHVVRIATHEEYRDFVVAEGLLFFPLGGDPRKLSSYMVKTKGRLIPDLTNVDERKELPEKMAMVRDITFSCWPACTAHDPEDPSATPFLADAIISNPIAYGHIHCAEALSVPLHIMFPQPWYPTKEFPHPLSTVRPTLKWSIANRLTYKAFDEFMWAGLKSVVNEFRRQVLKLSPIRTGEGGDSLLTSKDVPISHMWSRSFVPSCLDWPSHVNVVGDFTRVDSLEYGRTELSPYLPHPLLQEFFDKLGDLKPVYIGFGSMVIDDAQALLSVIKTAAMAVGVPLILQNGWTKYAEDYTMISDEIMVIGALPHDWLFARVAAVVHHGGAGTTSAGLRAGNPTFICPFFGDQHFWAEMVHRAGAGPKGCPIAHLTVHNLKEALLMLTSTEVASTVSLLSKKMNSEEGVKDGINSFINHLPLADMVCEISLFMGKSDLAKVYCRECGLKMSITADVLIHRDQSGREGHHRIPYRTMNWKVRPTDILEGFSQGFGCAFYELAGGILGLVNRPIEELRCNDSKIVGLSKGLAKGLAGLVARPIKAGGILTSKIVESINAKNGKSNVLTVQENVKERHSYIKDFFYEKLSLPDMRDAVYDQSVKIFQLETAYYQAINYRDFWSLMDEDNNRSVSVETLKCFIPLEEAEAVIAAAGSKLDSSITFAELACCLVNHRLRPKEDLHSNDSIQLCDITLDTVA